ncbi:MAG TPA: CoA ester lyase [Pseudonocardiaceae bacterium]
MIGRARTWLYVPAHRPELLAKAMAGDADAVVLDLEDAVPAAAKEAAREHAAAAVGAETPKPLWVRINQPGSAWAEADIAALAGCGTGGVRVPKCADPAEAARLAQRLGTPVHLLVESALGVENAFELARCHPSVVSVSLGEADLRADLRVSDPAGLDWARARIVNACRAAGLAGPPHAAWTDVSDVDGLVADTERARDRGFFGRSVLHPTQINPVNAVFTPHEAEVAAARALLDSLRGRTESGLAAWLDERGRFIDPAVVAGASWLVERADTVADTVTGGNNV